MPRGPTRRPDTFTESGYFTDDPDRDELDHLRTVEQPCISFVTLRSALDGIVNRPLVVSSPMTPWPVRIERRLVRRTDAPAG